MIVTFTYNHEKYIEETLKGIVMQQVNFPIIACILDDCSTDGTAEIIRRYESLYPHIIKGYYFEENQYIKGINTFNVLIPMIDNVKYIAMCEGDDYWTDPLKLQKQVALMEDNPDCTLSFHNVIEHWEEENLPDNLFYPVENRSYSGAEILKQWIVATVSVMIRAEVLKYGINKILTNRSYLYVDLVTYIYCSSVGKCIGMSDVMGVYRRLNQGFTQTLNKNMEQSHEFVWRYCIHIYELYKTFGNSLGREFRDEAASIFLHNVNGKVKTSIIRHEYGIACLFFIRSIVKFPIKTLGFYLSYLRKTI